MRITINIDDSKWNDIEEVLPKDEELVYFKCNYMDLDYITIGYLIKGNREHSFGRIMIPFLEALF